MTTTTKKVLITGTSAGGIGEFITRSLLENENVEVIGLARRQAEYGERYTHIQGDISDPSTIEKVKNVVGDRLDAAVFNAGILGEVNRVENANIESVKHVFEINYFGPIVLTKAVLPALRAANGRAIYTSSLASENPVPGWLAYGGSKAALNTFVAILATEEPQITALAIEPGLVDTPMQATIREKQWDVMSKEAQRHFLEMKEKGLLVNPKDTGTTFAKMALHAKHDWSGKYAPWNDPLFENLN